MKIVINRKNFLHKNYKEMYILKKILKVFIITLILILTILYSFIDSVFLKINWGIYLPKPIKNNIIYRFDYKEGDDFEIWEYSNSKLEKVKSKNYFNVLTDTDINDVKNYINVYYEEINKEEKSKFNANFDINKIVVPGNYYALIREENNYLLLLLDDIDNKIYYMNHIR